MSESSCPFKKKSHCILVAELSWIYFILAAVPEVTVIQMRVFKLFVVFFHNLWYKLSNLEWVEVRTIRNTREIK